MSERKVPVDPNEVITVPTKFKCWRCGACCQSIGGIEGYETLDDGTGTCIHFDRKTRNCQIYENRPLLCNVWGLYHEIYEGELSEEDYALLNIESCRNLRAELGLPEPEVLLARKKAREAGVARKPEPKPRQQRRPVPRHPEDRGPVTEVRQPSKQQAPTPVRQNTASTEGPPAESKGKITAARHGGNAEQGNAPVRTAPPARTKPEFKVVKGQAGRAAAPQDTSQDKTEKAADATIAPPVDDGSNLQEQGSAPSDSTQKKRQHEKKNWLGF